MNLGKRRNFYKTEWYLWKLRCPIAWQQNKSNILPQKDQNVFFSYQSDLSLAKWTQGPKIGRWIHTFSLFLELAVLVPFSLWGTAASMKSLTPSISTCWVHLQSSSTFHILFRSSCEWRCIVRCLSRSCKQLRLNFDMKHVFLSNI